MIVNRYRFLEDIASPADRSTLAEYLDVSLGDLIEGIALDAFEEKAPIRHVTVGKIEQLRTVYALSLTAADAHYLEQRS